MSPRDASPSHSANHYLQMARTVRATGQRTLAVDASDLAKVLTVAAAAVAIAEAKDCRDQIAELRSRRLLDRAVAELRFAEAVSAVGGTDDQPA